MSSWDPSQGGGGGGGSRQQPPGGGGSGGGGGPPDHNKNVNPKGPPLPPPMMRGTSHGGGGGGYGGNSNNNDPGGSGGIFPNSVPSNNFGGGGGRGRFGGGRHGGRFGGRGRHHGGRGLGRGGHPPHHRGSFSGGHPSGPPRIGRDRDERGGMIDNPPFGGERERDHHHPHSSPREMSGDFRGRGGDKFRGGDDGPSFRDRDVHRDSSLGPPPPVRDSPFRHAGGGGDRFERTRSDGAISSPYPSGLERRTSFDQQRGPYPRGPRDFDSRDPGRGPGGGGPPPPPQHWKDHRRIGSHGSHGSHGPIQSESSPGAPQPKGSSVPPFMTAPPMPSDRAGSIAPTDPRSRPTDPRRRGSSNDLPSTQGSYSSLAESTGPSSPSAVKGFRSSPQAMRRSISDAGVGRGYDRVGDNVAPSPRVAKSMRSPSDDRPQYPSMPPADLNGPQQRQPSRGGLGPKPMDFHSSSSSELGSSGGIKEPVFASRRDPRSQYTDGPSSTGNTNADAALNSQDPFGRTREWQQPRSQQLRRASSEGTVPRPSPRPSPSRAKSILSLTPINEKSVLQAPSLGSSTIAAAAAAAASGSSTVISKVAAEEKPVQIEELPSLKISSLGDEEVVKRAETAVLHLHEVVPDDAKDKQTTDDLPSKANMLEAMSKIEKLITASQNGMNDLSDEISKAKAREADLQAKEAKERAEEERKKSLELERIQNEKRMEEMKLKEHALQGALHQFKERSAEEKKKMQGEFDLSVEAAKEKATAEMNKALEADISQDSATIDRGISKSERELEKSRILLQKVGEKVASAEKTYRILLAEEQKEEDYDSGNSGVDPSSVVSSIFVENKRKAEEAQLLGFALADGISKDPPSEKEENGNFLEDSLYETKDPTCFKTFEEWAVMAQSVTGLSDALYSEPSEAPYYQFNEKRHEEMGPIVKEYIRSHKTKLNEHWKRLSEEYEVRKRLYEKQQRKLAKKSRGSISAVKKSIFAGNTETPAKESDEKEGKAGEASGTGGRSTNNPYRRARRGDPVRSEYEQEQIIAQITEKEAMEKRITHGGSKLPRQICPLEQELSAIYVNTFNSQRFDPAEEAREEAMTNIWTDMEKCIFLDRFLQFPKDFRRIASFLRNKTTQDCIAFYYDSKQTVPYKGALKEHILRRKRKGEYQVWDASIQSAVSCGAIISAGDDDEKPINFGLPVSDLTYRTCMLHPLRREALDSMEIDVASAEAYVSSGGSEEETTKWKSRKRGRDPLFSLSKEQTKRLRKSSQEALMNPIERAKLEEKEKAKVVETEPGASTPKRQAPQKWTATEKKIFVETLEEHGRDWAKLSQAVGTKSISQIKNFYYDFKKQLSSGKFRQGMEKGNFKSGPGTIASGSGEPSPAPKAKEESLKSPRQKLLKKKKKGAGGGVPPSLPKLGSKSMVKKTAAQNQAAAKRSRSATPTESVIPIQHDVLMQQEEMAARNEAQLHYQNQMSANPPMHSNELERILAGNPNYGGPNYASQSELIQHLLQQQQQQQPHLHHQSHPDHQYIADAESHLAARLLQQQQQQQQAQQRDQQSSLELFLRGQNSQQGLTLEDTRRLLQQQSQNYPHLQPQHGMPSGLQETAAAAPDLSDTSNIRRFLQLQQQHNPLSNQRSNLGSLLGLSSAADTGISASLLAQLRGGQPQQAAEPAAFGNMPNVQGFLGGGQQHQHQAQHQHQHQLGGQLPGGFHSSHNPMYHHTGSGASAGGQPDVTQSEAFALLQRAMQRDRNNFG